MDGVGTMNGFSVPFTASQSNGTTHPDANAFDTMPNAFDLISYEFSKYHMDPINVLFHLITSPLGVIGAFALLKNATGSSSIGITMMFIYLLNLAPEVPNGVFIGTVILSSIILHLVRKLNLGWISAIAMIALGYILQDLAHLATGEKTFQSTYSNGGSIDLSQPMVWMRFFTEHVYFLLPLVVKVTIPFLPNNDMFKAYINAPVPSPIQHMQSFVWLVVPFIILVVGSYCLDSGNGYCFFPGSAYFGRIMQCNIAEPDENGECQKIDLKIVRDWTIAHNPSTVTSSHWWFHDLNTVAKAAFLRCAQSPIINKMFRNHYSEKYYNIDIVEGMNEIYVSGPCRLGQANNSDQVFFSRHVDGPWGILPFVSVYRCIVGMDRNMVFTTHFPLAGVSVNACEGNVLAFDFNRELHYITADDSKRDESDDFRVTLKLHYCVYPKVLAPLGWLMHRLNVNYNRAFRALFLRTIAPTTLYEHFLAWNVNFSTGMFNFIETYLGQRNIVYFLLAASLWYVTDSYRVFFMLTSVIHYLRYISTFYVRRNIDFGSFKRDVLLFKTSALIQIFYQYFFPTSLPFAWDWISVSMICIGYGLSVAATNALGIDRTYFAAELGLLEPKWITQFPYGYIPHPMIVSQIIALIGIHKASHFRADWPYVIPVHVALYLTHMLQEHFNIYRKYDNPKEMKVKTL